MFLDILSGLIALPIIVASGAPFCRYYDKVRERGPGQGWGVNTRETP